MSEQYIAYHELMAIKNYSTNDFGGGTKPCWLVPVATTTKGYGVYLHDDGNIYNCLSRSSTGAGHNYNTTAEFKTPELAHEAACAYCNKYDITYPFALSDRTCYSSASQTMRFE